MRRAFAVIACLLALPAAPATARAAGGPVDPVVEAQNYAKTTERQALYDSPQGQLLLRQVSTRNGLAALRAQLADPERNFADDLCWNGNDGCAGDARLYDWGPKGYGLVTPVLFTARDGATLSGHVWATRAGPAQRPGVVIVNGSVQAGSRLAITLADGTKVDCETLRAGCPQLSDDEGRPGEYSYLALATSPDS